MGGGTIPSLMIQILTVLSIKQETTFRKNSVISKQWRIQQKGSPSLFCRSMLSSSALKDQTLTLQKNVEMEKWPVISSFLFRLDDLCLLESFWSIKVDVVYFFLASLCMSGLLSNRWVGLAHLLSAEDKSTLVILKKYLVLCLTSQGWICRDFINKWNKI